MVASEGSANPSDRYAIQGMLLDIAIIVYPDEVLRLRLFPTSSHPAESRDNGRDSYVRTIALIRRPAANETSTWLLLRPIRHHHGWGTKIERLQDMPKKETRMRSLTANLRAVHEDRRKLCLRRSILDIYCSTAILYRTSAIRHADKFDSCVVPSSRPEATT